MAFTQCVLKENGSPLELSGFNEILENIKETIEKTDLSSRANIAIIAEPFSGRSELLYKISEMCQDRETKIFFNRLVNDDNFLQILKKSGDVVLVDNCQLLCSRRIGGFEKLDLFLNAIALSNKLYITTWNKFSWDYLRFIYPLESIFPVRFELPRLVADELKSMVMANCEWKLAFAEDATTKKENWIESSEFPIFLKPLKKTIVVPIPKIDYLALRSRFQAKIKSPKKEDETTIEDKIFQRLKDASQGNPGVAKSIWKKSIPGAEDAIRPADIHKPEHKIDMKYDQAFLLYIILCMECISIDELKGIDPNANVDRLVQYLERAGLISVENKLLSILPEALHSIENFLKNMRLVG